MQMRLGFLKRFRILLRYEKGMDNLQKRRLISLQKEKKSAIINDAVLQFSPKREDSLLSERKVKSP